MPCSLNADSHRRSTACLSQGRVSACAWFGNSCMPPEQPCRPSPEPPKSGQVPFDLVVVEIGSTGVAWGFGVLGTNRTHPCCNGWSDGPSQLPPVVGHPEVLFEPSTPSGTCSTQVSPIVFWHVGNCLRFDSFGTDPCPPSQKPPQP